MPPRGPQGRLRLAGIRIPGPGVTEPGRRQHVDGLGLRALVGELDGHQQVVRAGLGVVHLGDPVPVAVERAGVQQLVLGLVPAPAGVGVDQVLVRISALGVVVAPPVPGVAGDGVQVPPVLLDVLAVVALRAGQPERALLQDGVAPVPQRQGKAQPLLDVAEPGQPVLPPPVGLRPGVVVRQVVPSSASPPAPRRSSGPACSACSDRPPAAPFRTHTPGPGTIRRGPSRPRHPFPAPVPAATRRHGPPLLIPPGCCIPPGHPGRAPDLGVAGPPPRELD